MNRLTPICRICGDRARGYNFDVISCMPCKAFFRRHALRLPGSLLCMKNNSCPINKENRSECSACRLQKCFILGMKRQLIQAVDRVETTVAWQDSLPLPKPIGVLQQDRSMMTIDEWTLLTNLIRLYDHQNIFESIRVSIIQEQAIKPVKLRSKPAPLINIIFESEYFMENLIRHLHDFQDLSMINRHRLLKNNFLQAIAMNTIIIDKCLKVSIDKNFDLALENLFGPGGLENIIIVREKMDDNIMLPKILLFIMLFSSNFSIVRFDAAENLQTNEYSIELVRIQDKYVTMLWKYMEYRFGYSEAVLRYSSMVINVMEIFRILAFLDSLSIFHLVIGMMVLKFNEVALSNV